MGNRICIMDKGKVVQIGAPLEVYRRPANLFVAGFLGNPPMNLVPARREGDRLGARRGAAGAAAGAGARRRRARRPGVRRPPGRPGARRAGRDAIATEVTAVEPLGAETIALLRSTARDAEMTARLGRDASVRVADRLHLRPDLAKARLFDRPRATRSARLAAPPVDSRKDSHGRCRTRPDHPPRLRAARPGARAGADRRRRRLRRRRDGPPGALDHRIRPIGAAAFRRRGADGVEPARDNLAAYAAIDYAEPGDVIVIETGDYEQAAVVGDAWLGVARNKGVVACVTDGLVRDVDGIDAVGIPVFARGLSPNSPFKDGPGEIGLPIVIGGLAVALRRPPRRRRERRRRRAARARRRGRRRARRGRGQGGGDGRGDPRRRERARPGCWRRSPPRACASSTERRRAARLLQQHATEAVYGIIRARAAGGLRAGHARADDDAERIAKIRDGEVAIVASTPLRRAAHRRGDAAAPRAPPGRRLPRHHRLGGAGRAPHPARAHAGRHDHRRRRARGDADPCRLQAAALRRRRAAPGPLAHQRPAAGRASSRPDRRLPRHGPYRPGAWPSGCAPSARRGLYFDAAAPLPAARERELGLERVGFDALLARADLLSLHVPLTPATRHIVDAPRSRR